MEFLKNMKTTKRDVPSQPVFSIPLCDLAPSVAFPNILQIRMEKCERSHSNSTLKISFSERTQNTNGEEQMQLLHLNELKYALELSIFDE